MCLGIVAGVAAAYDAGRLVRTMLVGLSPDDPVTYAAVAVLLIAVAMLASYVPARPRFSIE